MPSFFVRPHYTFMKSTRYDSTIIQTFADRLYSQADGVVIICAVIGILVGLGSGYGVGGVVGAIVGSVIIGALGFVIGLSIAFQLKLKAQILLCQMQIEKNTRQTVEHTSAAISSPTHSAASIASPVAPLLSGTKARYYYSTNGEQEGPVDASDLRMMRKDGLITEDIPVLRDGETQWRRFVDYLELNR
jgi:predicted lipid-binding transport protein (Tim44 family)